MLEGPDDTSRDMKDSQQMRFCLLKTVQVDSRAQSVKLFV